MATTTNYGWTTPDDTALVKDGAAAIRSLGTAIDTSMNTALGTKKAGLVLLNTTSFSAVSSQSVNDVFSADYNCYFIDLNISTSAASGDINLRMRVGGSDTSSGIYRRQYIQASSTTLTGARSTTDTSMLGVFGFESSRNSSNNFLIVNPFETVPTTGVAQYSTTNSGNIVGFTIWYGMNDTVSYTGFTLIPSTGTMTGSVSVYGRKR